MSVRTRTFTNLLLKVQLNISTKPIIPFSRIGGVRASCFLYSWNPNLNPNENNKMTQLRRSLETSIFVCPNPNFVRTIFSKSNLTDRPIKKRSLIGFLDHFRQSYPLSPFNPVQNSNHVRTRVTCKLNSRPNGAGAPNGVAQRDALPRWALRLRWALLIKFDRH